MKRFDGFTLIELLVTVSVLAILLGIGIPSFNNFIHSSRLTSLTNELVTATHFARSESIRLNRQVTLCRAAANNSATCAGGGNTQWLHWLVMGGTVSRRGSPETVTNVLTTSTFTDDQIRFNPDGLPAAGGAVLVCTTRLSNENRRVITIGPGNRISVDRATGNCP
mgnify:CR=1 FL=1